MPQLTSSWFRSRTLSAGVWWLGVACGFGTGCSSSPLPEGAAGEAGVPTLERMVGGELRDADNRILEAAWRLQEAFGAVRNAQWDKARNVLAPVWAMEDLSPTFHEWAYVLDLLASLRINRFSAKNAEVPNVRTLAESQCARLCRTPAWQSIERAFPRPDNGHKVFDQIRKHPVVELLDITHLPKKSQVASGKVTEKPGPEEAVPQDALGRMKSLAQARRFRDAAEIARRQETPERADRCSPAYLYSRFVLGQHSRFSQRRSEFFRHQRDLVALLNARACTATDLAMAETDFIRFEIDARLWLARLFWENNLLDPAFEAAFRSYSLARRAQIEDLALEAVQVLVGRIGYETRAPFENLRNLTYFETTFPWSTESFRWILTRRGLFEFLSGQFSEATATLTRLEQDAGLSEEQRAFVHYWKARSLAASGQRELAKAAFEAAAAVDVFGYYDVLSNQALKEIHGESFAHHPPVTLPSAEQLAANELLPDEPFSLPALDGVDAKITRRLRAAYLLAIRSRANAPTEQTASQFATAIQQENSLFARFIRIERDAVTKSLMDLMNSEQKKNSGFPDAVAAAARLCSATGDHQQAILMVARMRGRGLYRDPQDSSLLGLYFPRPFREDFQEAATACSVDSDILYAIGRQESLFRPSARSHVGAMGLLQLLPETAKKYAPASIPRPLRLEEPRTNAHAGACYLQTLLRRYDGNFVFAFAAYNAGESAVDEWVRRRYHTGDMPAFVEMVPFQETQDYVRKVLRNYYNVKTIHSNGGSR